MRLPVTHPTSRRAQRPRSSVRLAGLGLAAALAAGLSGCTTTARPAERPDPMGAAITQPFHDLNLVRSAAPAGLVDAAAAPYRPAVDCAAVHAELAVLDGWLGPDVDAPSPAEAEAAGLAGDVVTGVASLPFRGLVRRLSGAKKRDEAVAAAVLGAMVRRGFLRGQAAALACPAPAPAA